MFHHKMSQKAKQRPGTRDVGPEYEIKVITFVASSLSNNRHVEDFVIYTNLREIPGYDDIVACVLFKNNTRKVYLIQVKHRTSKIIFVTDGHSLKSYKDSYYSILERKDNIEYLKEIPKENIKFCFFSNNNVRTPIIIEKRTNESDLECTIKNEDFKEDILKCKQNSRFILQVDENQTEYYEFFKNFYLYLNQPDNDKIFTFIQQLHGVQFSKENTQFLFNNIKDHFSKKVNVGLSKTIFELHLLKIHLSQWIVKPSKLRMTNKEQAAILNYIILKRDLTIINDANDIEKCIFGCLQWQLNNVYNIDFDWNGCLTDGGYLKKFFKIELFIERARQFKNTHTWTIPETLEQLLLEMWKFGDFPLILKPHSIGNIQDILEKYKHLGKHFILISDKKTYQFSSDMKIFQNADDVDDFTLQGQLLKSIRVSLQGRDVVSIKEIVGNSTKILKCLTVNTMLKLIQKRMYIKEDCFYNTQHIIFLLRGDTKFLKDDMEILRIDDLQYLEQNGSKNIFVEVDETEDAEELIQNLNIFKNYTLQHVNIRDMKYEVITEHFNGISKYIFEEYPRIGNALENPESPYIERVFNKIILKEDAFYSNNKNIFLLSGDLTPLRRHIKTIIRQYPVNTSDILNLYENENAIIHLAEDKVEECWNQFLLATSRPMFYLRTTSEGLELLRWKNYSAIYKYLEKGVLKTYTVDESKIFDYYGNQLIAITADPGMGKTSTLKSLSRKYTPHEYVISVNLANCRGDMDNNNNEIFLKPLDYFFKKMESDNPNPFLRTIYECHKSLMKIAIFLDSFDEILPLHGENALLLIEKLLNSGLRIWITSRPQANILIEEKFDIIPINLTNLTESDVKNYLQLKNISEQTFKAIPQKFLENPLHLSLTTALAKTGRLNLKEFDVTDVYKKFIEMKIDIYFNKMKIDKNTRFLLKAMETFLVEGHHILALILMYGKESILNTGIITENELSNIIRKFDSYEYSMGLVIILNKGNPLFVHQTYAEYLTAEWLFLKKHEHYFDSMYRKTVTMSRYGNICNFFNRLVCKNMSLHMTVLNAKVSAQQIIEMDDRYVVDDCGRNILHLAAHCTRDTDEVQTYNALEIIIQHFDKEKINLRDRFMNWTWLDYAKKSVNFYHNICAYGLKNTVSFYIGQNILEKISLHAAAQYGQCEIIKLLVNKADLSLKDFRGNTALYLAAKYGHLDVIKILLNNDDDVSRKNEMESTALHAAADGGHLKIVEELLNNGASVLAEDIYGKTVIYRAIENGRKELVCMLLDLGFKMPKTDRNGKTGLHSAIEKGHVDLVVHLLKHNYDTDVEDSNGTTIIHWATEEGYLEVVTELLKKDYDISKPDNNGQTPLHIASSKGFHAIVDMLLLNNDINTLVENKDGSTPLHLACSNNHYNVVKSLISKGETLSRQDSSGNTPLHIAASMGYLNIVQLLLDVGINDEEKDKLSRSALSGAVRWGHTEITRILIERGINRSTNFGSHELHLAIEYGFKDVAWILINAGADLSYKSVDGETILMSAIRKRFVDIIEALLQTKMDLPAVNSYGETSLLIACEYGYEDIVDLLLEAHADVQQKDKYGRSALQRATQKGFSKVILSLLKYGANIHETDEFGKTILMHAIQGHYIDICRLLIDENIDLYARDIFGNSAIDYAFTTGDVDLIKLLLEKTNAKHIDSLTLYENIDKNLRVVDFLLHSNITVTNELRMLYWKRKNFAQYQNKEVTECNGSCQSISRHDVHSIECLQYLLIQGHDINEKGDFGRTKLHWAVIYGDKDLVAFLIAKNIDVNAQDKYGNSCLHYALNQQRDSDFLEILLKSNVNVNITNIFEETPLHVAASIEWSWNVIQVLSNYDAIIDKTDCEGNTPLHVAILRNCNASAQDILEKSNTMTANNKGNSPLHSAVLNSNYTSVLDLIEHGADVNSINSNGDTALHLVKRNISGTNITKCLIKHKALLSTKNNQGNTPLHMLVLSNNDECFEILRWRREDIDAVNNDGETVSDLAKKLNRISHQNLLNNRLRYLN